ncbi:MAG: NigD-like N-terminal domain-containing protein [Bacteroidales bacterium]|nr:NigD-like N-terminal domain-containing protein [Bacteroidales bacterium]
MRKLFTYGIIISLCLAFYNCDKEDKNDKEKITLTANGTIIDLTDLDGCGYVIQLDDGTYLEPKNLDTCSSIIKNNQRVYFSYEIIPKAESTCMIGEVVNIVYIEEISCQSLLLWDDPGGFAYPDQFPHDDFYLDTTYIIGDCLFFVVGYSGGCKTHEFTLGRIAVSSLYNDFALTHDSNGDACEAYIMDTISFDLTPLQITNQNEIEINISTYTNKLNHYYTMKYNY